MIAPARTAARDDHDALASPPMDLPRRRQAIRDLLAERRMTAARRSRRPDSLQAFAELGIVLRRLRHRTGLTQNELARAAGVTRPMISAFENEKTYPSLATLDRLLTTLDVTVAELGREIEAADF